MSPPEPLDAAALMAALKGQLIGRRVVVLVETSSTNDAVFEMAPSNAEGLVVLAEHQTAGRGQHGRIWESSPGKGLWMSILLRPRIEVADSARITNFLASAIAVTIRREINLEATIKPPNDVYLEGRKVAGVLVEMRVETEGAYCAIAGLGINANQTPEDFPPEIRETAGSLAMMAGRAVDRPALAIAVLRELETGYGSLGSARL